MFRKPADGVVFADDKVENAFNLLSEDDWLEKAIRKAVDELKDNVFCGGSVPKKQIPKEYIQKYGVDNLWWYQLSNAWRLIYWVMTPSNVEILAVILEYFDHKNYERRFKY